MNNTLASPPPPARHALRIVGGLAVLMVALSLLPLPDRTLAPETYLPLHTALETLAVVISAMIFATVWSLRHESLAPCTMLLACVFLGSALLDVSHALSYAGMPDYVTPGSTEKAILFWLAARLLDALGLLAFAWQSRALARRTHSPALILAAVLVPVALVHLAILGNAAWLPRTYVPGQGLTGFKVGSEYVLITLYLLAAFKLWQRLREPGFPNAALFFMAAAIAAMSEVFFARYARASDLYNLVGHLYKVLAFVYLYRAAFANTVRQPYGQLRTALTRQRAMLAALPDLLFVVDGEGRYLEVHAGSAGGLLAGADGLIGKTVKDVMRPREAQTVLQALQEAGHQGISRGKIIALELPGGELRSFELSVARAMVDEGDRPLFVVISRDVTRREKTAQTLRMFSYAVAQSPATIIITDLDARITYVNPAFAQHTGYGASEVMGRNPRLLKSGKTSEATYRAMWSELVQGRPWRGEVINLTKAGEETVDLLLIHPLRDASGAVTHYLSYQIDITAEREASRRIEHLVNYDQLTGLPSRHKLMRLFEQMAQRQTHIALFWIDLDHFKDINDSLGHGVGDQLLVQTARRLRSALDEQSIVSRHSGDEFTLLLPNVQADEAMQTAQRLLALLCEPMQFAEHTISSTASIGVALFPQHGRDFEALLKSAEAAAYQVKRQGRNHACLFTAQMQEHATRLLALNNALKQALANGELHLVYQPQQDLGTGAIIGAEALLRWTHPRWGVIPPAEFIPLAESNGLIIPIGEWVLRTALDQLRQWLNAGLPPMVLSVNLSAVQFGQANLPALVRHALHEADVPAHCLALELTEAVALKAPNAATQHMQELRALGVQLAIDDFGTGYSSLSYLKRFKIHKLKIDQSFVHDIHVDPDDQAIVVAIIQLARGLGVRTLAEGVETAEQRDFLLEHGCTEIQGYHLSQPLAAPQFAPFVQQHQASGRGVGALDQ
jgi:diguanylate cyclase (GGDEF)-like protein/PAS domain S-box-containing protein